MGLPQERDVLISRMASWPRQAPNSTNLDKLVGGIDFHLVHNQFRAESKRGQVIRKVQWIDWFSREGCHDGCHRVVLDQVALPVIWGLGFGVWGLRFGVWGLGFGT